VANCGSLVRPEIELGFEIKGYPASGRRTELEADLALAEGPDLIQGAFMGDAVFRLGDVDFSTHFGWVTLLYWLVSMAFAVKEAAASASGSSWFRLNESDDFVSFRLCQGRLFVACSYSPEIAVVSYVEFAEALHAFIDEKLSWVSVNYPRAMLNPELRTVIDRIGF
jgi:hypothetical protein